MVPILIPVRKYLSKFWDANFIFRNAFIPLLVLTLYFFLCAYFLPEGVNKTFAQESWPFSLGFTTLSGLFALVLWKLKVNSAVKRSAEEISVQDLILIFLPLTPVVQYLINNQDILSIWESVLVLVIFSIISVVFIIVLPKILRKLGSTRTLAILGLTVAFIFIEMATLSRQFSWFEIGSLKIQWVVFAGVFLAVWLLYDLNYKKLVYFLIVIYFLSNTAVQAFSTSNNQNNQDEQANSFSKNRLVELVGKKTPASTPSVYLLIYDGYAHNETMLSYGIDNSYQEKYLEERRFKLYPRAYSIGASSLSTMTRVLNVSPDSYGNFRRAVSGDGVVQNLLKSLGYKTFGIFRSAYFFRNIGASWDSYFPPLNSSSNLLLKGIVLGEFKFDLEFDLLSTEEFLTAKRGVFEASEGSKFIYTHTGPAHSQNSGACLSNETELYQERLERANAEMRDDVETLMKSDPNSIIIVAGDHGPYLTKNCTALWLKYKSPEVDRLDVQDRFGTFLAIRWPDEKFEKYDDIAVLQDIFPAVFAYLFKDQNLLKSKLDPVTLDQEEATSGVEVQNGIIRGGIDDGKALFTVGE